MTVPEGVGAAGGVRAVTVVCVNLNGARYLPELLSSLNRQKYRNFDVIVVDNGSTDGSIEILKKDYPEVRVLEAGCNLGFTGGNNLGMRAAQGKYVALLNNDTIVDSEWLSRLVEEAERQPRIGAVASKILFAKPYLPVQLALEWDRGGKYPQAEHSRENLCFLAEESGFLGCSYGKKIPKEGFNGSGLAAGRRGWWFTGRGEIYLPVNSRRGPFELNLSVLPREDLEGALLSVSVDGLKVGAVELGPGLREYRLPVRENAARERIREVINNAGSEVRADGYAKDRGIFELDRGQFDAREDVTGICGCSVLLSREALEAAGMFDEDLFMYFEDIELSWRLRKRGYCLRYEPRSVVRHYHASTSGEGSPFFVFQVARNRILLLLKHGNLRNILRAYLSEMHLIWVYFRNRNRDSGYGTAKETRDHLRLRLRVQRSLLVLGPRAILKRIGILRD